MSTAPEHERYCPTCMWIGGHAYPCTMLMSDEEYHEIVESGRWAGAEAACQHRARMGQCRRRGCDHHPSSVRAQRHLEAKRVEAAEVPPPVAYCHYGCGTVTDGRACFECAFSNHGLAYAEAFGFR